MEIRERRVRVKGKPGVALMGCRWGSQNIDLTHGITENLYMNTFESEKSSYTGKKIPLKKKIPSSKKI